MTDPTITIAGLEARIKCLVAALRTANTGRAEAATLDSAACGYNAQLRTERDALAAQLAEVRAELAAAPKVCAIHSYALEGPCMTCGAPWPGAEKALRQERIEGMEKMRRISAAVGCPNSVEEVVEAVAAIKSDLASERAHLAACRTRIAGLERAADERSKEVARVDALFEEARGALVDVATALNVVVGVASPDVASRCRAEVARLTARVAELEARPVLTVEMLDDAMSAVGYGAAVLPGIPAQLMRHLGPVTLPAQDRAEELCRAYHERAADMDGHMVGRWQYHGPESQAICTEAMERALASLGAPPTSPPAARPVFAGVSEDDLCVQMLMAADPSIDPGIALVMVNGVHRAKVRAVLARLEVSLVAPVDPEQMARDFAAGVPVRATLIARGIPVTPEVGK